MALAGRRRLQAAGLEEDVPPVSRELEAQAVALEVRSDKDVESARNVAAAAAVMKPFRKYRVCLHASGFAVC